MKMRLIILLGLMILYINGFAQYSNNEDGTYQDMLTPEYYNSTDSSDFRQELNAFVHYARALSYNHPFQDSLGHIAPYTIKRDFGDGIGRGGSGSHHPASDYYVGNTTQVNMYAAHDGVVAISKEVNRYRHYLSITTDVTDDSGTKIGKMMTIYAHIDLDLDSAALISLDGKFVKRGDLVSKHLYSGTVGGPHLHFEIRYYRSSDTGEEDFYGGNVGGNTSPSAGSWMYGYWNPSVGYGFANPLNHINTEPLSLEENTSSKGITVFPNPSKGLFTIGTKSLKGSATIEVLNLQGKLIEIRQANINNAIEFDLSTFTSGVYLIRIGCGLKYCSTRILIE